MHRVATTQLLEVARGLDGFVVMVARHGVHGHTSLAGHLRATAALDTSVQRNSAIARVLHCGLLAPFPEPGHDRALEGVPRSATRYTLGASKRLMITRIAISGYRSLRDLRLALGQVTLITGPNGSGKSNLYRAMRLLADVAQGQAVRSLATEGGLDSTYWAGPESISRAMRQGVHDVEGSLRKRPIALRLGFSAHDLGYAIDLGLPAKMESMFQRDPHIKLESLWTGEVLSRKTEFARRINQFVRIRDADGEWIQVMHTLNSGDSMMTHCADPKFGFELLALRERMRRFRFYDHFRSDRDALARRAQIGTFTPTLAADGGDLPSAIQSILEVGEGDDLQRAVEDAFPGSTITIQEYRGYFEVEMQQHGLLRPLRAAELSDGTLRYLLWIAALLAPYPPEVMVLNEPETSLHPSLIQPLARLILNAATRAQILVISHDAKLIEALMSVDQTVHIALKKDFGETVAEQDERPKWVWPER
jgi:predicted ATPase